MAGAIRLGGVRAVSGKRAERELEVAEGGPSISELRLREDGFTPEKQKTFLKTLRKTGCVADAARTAGISTTTIGRLRRKFADFDARCAAARRMALPELEAIAYARATVGAPAKIVRKGKLFEVRVKPSDSILRLLLAGAAPKKYGRYAGLPAAKGGAPGALGPEKWSFERSLAEIEKALEIYRLRRAREAEDDGEDEEGAAGGS